MPARVLRSVVDNRVSHEVSFSTTSPPMLRSFFEKSMLKAEEDMAISLWLQMVQIAITNNDSPEHGGSRPDKSANIQQNYTAAYRSYMVRYFLPTNYVDLNQGRKVLYILIKHLHDAFACCAKFSIAYIQLQLVTKAYHQKVFSLTALVGSELHII